MQLILRTLQGTPKPLTPLVREVSLVKKIRTKQGEHIRSLHNIAICVQEATSKTYHLQNLMNS